MLRFVSIQAQDIKIEKEFSLIQSAYKKSEYLSYTVQYLYAKEKTPHNYIDTVNGKYRINRNRFWGVLDNVEFIQDDSLFISLYPEDKVIFLSSAAPDWMSINPNWDSIWKAKKESVKVLTQQEGDFTKIEMLYTGDSATKKTELWYNTQSHMLQKIIYVIKQPYGSASGYDESEAEQNEEGEFAVIEIRFSEYSNTEFDLSVLNANEYVKKNGKEYLPAEKYQDYKIFIGSPNLVN